MNEAKNAYPVAPETLAVAAEAEVDSSWLDTPAGFDRSRPFGTVHDGSGSSKAAYQQDGKFYDHAGDLVKE
jgi:hypothetical protein